MELIVSILLCLAGLFILWSSGPWLNYWQEDKKHYDGPSSIYTRRNSTKKEKVNLQ